MRVSSAPRGYYVMLVIVVVQSYHTWIKPSVASLLCKLSGCFLIPWGNIQVSFSSGSVWSIWYLQQQQPTFHLWGLTKGDSNSLQYLESWTTLTSNSKYSFSSLVLCFCCCCCCRVLFFRWSLTFGGALSIKMRKFHSYYLWTFLYTQTCVHYDFKTDNNVIPYDIFQRSLLFSYCSLPSFALLCLSPCPLSKLEPPFPNSLMRWIAPWYYSLHWPLSHHQPWKQPPFTSLVSAFTPGYVLTSEDLELGALHKRK